MKTNKLQEATIESLSELLKPIIRICLRNSLKLSDLVHIAKAVFVQVAQEELIHKEEIASFSKVSIMTGVHRKDVTRLIREELPMSSKGSLISKVMTQWQHDPHFQTKSGKPRTLTAEGRKSEFAQLVTKVNGENISAYTVLYEMERIGAVKRVRNKLKLVWQDYVNQQDVREAMRMLAEDASDLITAVEENVFTDVTVPHLHLKTEFDRIDEEAVPDIKSWLLKEGSAFHAKVSKFLSRYDADMNSEISATKANARIAFGSFSFTEDISRKVQTKKTKFQ